MQMGFRKRPLSEQTADSISQLYPNIDEKKIALPRCWSHEAKCEHLGLSNNNLVVSYKGQGNDKSHKDAGSVRTAHPIPPGVGIYYFEIFIVSKGRDGYMGVGISSQSQPNLNRLPGWDKDSYGYHGDDGNSFCSKGSGQPYGPTFTTGDTIGCGVNFVDKTCFFTKNGINLGAVVTDLPVKPYYPTVGLQTPGETVEANFGQKPFVFDLCDMRLEAKYFINKAIRARPVDNTQLQSLVSSYLIHHGYSNSATAFAKQTKVPISEGMQSIENRKHLQKLVLEGEVTEALKETDRLYPNLLSKNPKLEFLLKCQQFVELVVNSQQLSNDTIHESTPSCSNSFNRASESSVPEMPHCSNSSNHRNLNNMNGTLNNDTNAQNFENNEHNSACSNSWTPQTSLGTTELSGATRSRQEMTPGVSNVPHLLSVSPIQYVSNSGPVSSNGAIENNATNSFTHTEASLPIQPPNNDVRINDGDHPTDHVMMDDQKLEEQVRVVSNVNEVGDNSCADMELEINGTDFVVSSSAEINNGETAAHMHDTNNDQSELVAGPSSEHCSSLDNEIMKAVVLGRSLRQLADKVISSSASNDISAAGVEQYLLEIFGLLAYENPKQSQLKRVLEPNRRESVCSSLNGAVLQFYNMSSDPPLATITWQVLTCLQQMTSLGLPEAAFVDLIDIIRN